MKKRNSGIRTIVVGTALLLAALSVSTLMLRAFREMDAHPEVLVKRDISQFLSVNINSTIPYYACLS